MKLTVRAIVLAALMPITSATAQEDGCQLLGNMAAVIMWNRQLGTPISDMWEIAQNADDENSRILAEAMVIDAYNSPRFSTDVSRLMSVEGFRAEIEAICYEELGL